MTPARRVVIGSVAGQPAAALARVLARAALAGGRAAAIWDPHAVRPGSVETHLHLDARAGVARIAPDACDLVVGLEALEGLRQATRFYRPGLHLALLDVVVPPVSVLHGGRAYPDPASVVSAVGGGLTLHRLPGPGRPGAPAAPAHLAAVLGLVAALDGALDGGVVRGLARAAFPGWPPEDLDAGYEAGRRAAGSGEGA